MTQPSFVPITEADQVRSSLRLHVPGRWKTDRPAETVLPSVPPRRRMGSPGPDQGYALGLARRVADRLRLTPGESEEDVLMGIALVASRRASLSGRAPCIHDVTAALDLWGFQSEPGDAPGGMPGGLAARQKAFQGAGHDYTVQRELVDGVPEEALRSRPV